MNKLPIVAVVLTLTGFFGTDLMAQKGKNGHSQRGNQRNAVNGAARQQYGIGSRSGVQNVSLSQQERNGLILMREEEKLARDVYLALSKKWNMAIFGNIAQAESRHMNAMAQLLTRYKIEDPVVDDTPGAFQTAKFKELYKSLVQTGSKSQVNALRVGLEIEELDIADLRGAIQSTNKDDITRVLQNLERASRNHLRAFSSQLKSHGGTYAATHLAQDEFDKIASSSMERGGNQGGGNQGGGNRGRGKQGRGGRNQGRSGGGKRGR